MEILLDELTHLLTMKQHKHIRITSSERVSMYIPVCACMEGKGHGKYSILCIPVFPSNPWPQWL